MSPLDRYVVERKLAILLEEIEHLNAFVISRPDFSDFKEEYSLLHSLQRALASLTDIAQHIVVRESGGVPDTYVQAVKQLSSMGAISAELGERLQKAVSFRNKIVHDYEVIDISRILAFLPLACADMKSFACEIKRYVGEHFKPGETL